MADGEFREFDVSNRDDLGVVNHNKKDMAGYDRLRRRINQQYGTIEKERARAQRAANVETWDAGLAYPWNQAKLSTLVDRQAALAAHELSKEKNRRSVYVKGAPGTGKTFLALALVRRYIGMGVVSPYQVKHLSEERLLSNLRAGFKGQATIDALMSRDITMYVIDNVGSKDMYNDRELGLWEHLLDHITQHNLTVIFTSINTPKSFSDKLSSAAASKFSHLISGRVVRMTGAVSPPSVDDDLKPDPVKEPEEDGGLWSAFAN